MLVGAAILFAAQYALKMYIEASSPDATTAPSALSTQAPDVQITTVLSGLSHPWDVGFLPDGQMIFNQRKGTISVVRDSKAVTLAQIGDVLVDGEGGLLGLAVDPAFADNRFIYTCFNSTKGGPDVRIARWRVNAGVTALEDRKDIVTTMPSNTAGRHSGCRIVFGPDGYLWVGTGDSARPNISPQTSQNPQSLGGKILRIDRDGKGAVDNLGKPFDNRIYSYGHRNTQGIAFLPQPLNGVVGFSAEHGSTVDDEINPLKKGNFGWDPDVGYLEIGVPMTGKQKFPDAIDALWRSGSTTQAPSGLAVISGKQWKAWDGAIAMAMLKATHLKILTLDKQASIVKEERILTDKGRIRSVHQGPDGNVYVTTDNGTNDEIIRLMVKR